MAPFFSQLFFPFLFFLIDASILPSNFQKGDLDGSASPDEKFTECCQKETQLKEQTVKDGCHYPPSKMNFDEKLDIAANFEHYFGCYGAHKNNRECCINAGVVGKYKDCQDLCDGANPPKEPDYKYLICTQDISPDISMDIAKCNKAAWGPGMGGNGKGKKNGSEPVKMMRTLLLAELAEDLKAFKDEEE